MAEPIVCKKQMKIQSLIVVGVLIPFIYQIGLSVFAFLTPLTLVPPAGWIALHVLTDCLFVACPLLAVRQPLKEAWRTLGGKQVPWLDGVLAVGIGLLLSYDFEVLYNAVAYTLWQVTPDFGFPQSAQDVVPFVLLVVIIGPVGEETFFRGYFGHLVKRPWLFLLLSSLVWAALHIDPVAFIPYVWTGLILGYLRQRFQSFYPSLALHLLLNVH
jgi:membrane protease YdiL (CAAX protease family)